jgi:D-alanyl-D-alanine dipeptidase
MKSLYFHILFLLSIIFFFISCGDDKNTTHQKSLYFLSAKLLHVPHSSSAFEKALIKAGLVDVSSKDSTIAIDLKYSSKDNFLGKDVYGNFNKCYLQKDAALKLVNAQKKLKELKPGYSLIIWDAARPRYVQQMMWDTLKIPFNEKIKFLSNPKYGSNHNFGEAVDLSILDEHHHLLDMATPFDFMGEMAYSTAEERLFREGKLTQEQYDNRRLLHKVMYSAGFFNIQTEWWHYNACTRDEAVKKYKIIE